MALNDQIDINEINDGIVYVNGGVGLQQNHFKVFSVNGSRIS